MRRRLTHTPCLTALVLISTLTLSFVVILPARSPSTTTNADSVKIVSMLELLRGNVTNLGNEAFGNTTSGKGHKTALVNKIDATIHQIEAYIKSGNKRGLSGPLNKLENDVNKTVTEWIYPYSPEDAERLFDLILEIIKLIKGELPQPDFSIEASPTSLTIALGESDSSTITITSLNGFCKFVHLTVSGVPSGVTATLDPTQITPPPDSSDTSTLTVHVDLTAVLGSYVLTVTGRSGALEHSVDITLEIIELPPPPDFAISASPTSLTIQQGDSDSSTITITSLHGFSAPVDLTVTSPSITGVTTTLDPTQVTPPPDGTETSMLSVDVDLSALPGTYTLTVTGTSGEITHSTDITLEITELPPSPDFSIEASPTSLTIVQGDADTTTITITSLNGFNQPVQLSVSGAPSGVTATPDPEQVTPPADGSITSTLKIDVDLSAVPATYTLTVTGTSGTLEHTLDIDLEVTELPPVPDFAISASPASLTVVQGESATSTITITSLNGFSKAVDLTVSGEPMGVTATLDPTQVTPPKDGSTTSTLTVDVGLSAAAGTYTLTVTGTSVALEHEAEIELTVVAVPDFSISASPTSLTIQQGDSDSSTITITSLHGFSAAVDLAVTSPPITGVTTTLDLTQVTPPADGSTTSALTVQVDESATPGTYTLTVTGASGSLLHSVDIELEITTVPPSPDFSIAVNPSSLGIQQGSSDAANIIITSLNGFSDPVTLTVSPIIDGVTYSLDPPAVTPPADGTITSTLTITVAETAVPDTHVLTLTGTSGSLQHNASLSLEITSAPPPLDVEPPTVRIDKPANGSYVAGLVNILVFMYDENFKRAELTINNTLIALWTPENVSTGEHSILWDTTLPEYPDDSYNITLSAEDEAGNTGEKTIKVIVDNTSPTIESAAWTPKEPFIDEQVDVTVKVSDPQPSSGIQNVTLWYRNTTMDGWQPIPMSLNVTSGNWTATIPAQSMETTIEFYIEAFDNVGNKAISDEIHEYEVIAPPGIPLAWIVAIILLILAATAAAIYFWRKRRREKQGVSSSRVENYKLTILLCF